jgi:AhpD family alkylhydroperoxidase
MTTTQTYTPRLDFDTTTAAFSQAMAHLDRAAAKELDKAGIEPQLRELIRIRASQLNGCAYCVDMHTKDARAIGETQFFTSRERAALAFAESVTLAASTHVPDRDFEAVAAQFSPAEIGALIALIATINSWNTIGVSARPWEPGSYQP